MKTIELFSGTKSFSKIASGLGHSTLTIDNNKYLEPDCCFDMLDVRFTNRFGKYDILWASPPCQAFSVASIGKHWGGGHRKYIPKTEFAKLGLKLIEHTIKIILQLKPTYWFIENPRGVMRKIIDELFKKNGITNYKRETICYCRYGDKRMKPTDIWTNCFEWNPINRMCHNGNKDHTPAPRGSKTGTQGLKGAKERSIIPPELFVEIFGQLLNEENSLKE